MLAVYIQSYVALVILVGLHTYRVVIAYCKHILKLLSDNKPMPII